jgi:hypothetical protein
MSVGDRIRWKPFGHTKGLIGHEGTIVAVSDDKTWCWVEYDDGTDKDHYLCELEKIEA